MAQYNVVVVGAGVIGLTTALMLSRDSRYSVTVVAKHMPGDYDIEYASPWAGANYMCTSKEGTLLHTYERNTWPELKRLVDGVPEAGLHYQDLYLYCRAKDANTVTGQWLSSLMQPDSWLTKSMPNFRKLRPSELPLGHETGTGLISVVINPMVYLPYLVGQLRHAGVVLKRAVVSHIADSVALHHSGKRADAVVNCTGLMARRLGGVEDPSVYPGRGQVVVVRNDPGYMIASSGVDGAGDECVYVMTRAAGGGTIIGGCLQKNNWDSQPDLDLANRIMKHAVELMPALTGGKGPEELSVVRHGVGLRPMRDEGIRLEKEIIRGVSVVHNYGHGSSGYQASYGSAGRAKELVDEAFVGVGMVKWRL